ncbi:NAD(P)/FAD-dependent oxidoreductase [[Mycobacterium] burgundiense]|uniref:FAD-dependent oxidoreductase n=1 Tax=[Mycobacterium] burgundiense TaxID=3064286 RepID=A0ABM9LLK1_9MYCO|nr:FAD-dependent oxidoreductase [Mycolicibacterium sp. MU0053]CAJ1500961.1 FAD-dependent oxidoreductase [Mycolicibacterium sp. MU0053]
MTERIDGGPRSVVVVGAGIVGLSTAWFLQERGVEVTVVDREGVAAGSSWGNAGWISPALTIPLNQPSVLRYGLKSLFSRTAPLHIPLRADLGLLRFLTRFALNCRRSRVDAAIRANLPFNDECLEAYDVLISNGVDAPLTDSAITALFENETQARELRRELQDMREAGQRIEVTELSEAQLRERVPLASSAATVGLSVEHQRYVDPGQFVTALGRAVTERGGEIRELRITDITHYRGQAAVHAFGGAMLTADAVVLATGAWLPDLTHRWIRADVRAGRGYSFTVPVERPLLGPIYLPSERVACTPYQGGLRVAGTMEFRGPDDPLVPARVHAVAESASRLLDGVNWEQKKDVWVGPRPVTPDGLPLIGELADGVFVAGGHGMWGLAHGPVTGRLLAEQITTGKQPDALRPFQPYR